MNGVDEGRVDAQRVVGRPLHPRERAPEDERGHTFRIGRREQGCERSPFRDPDERGAIAAGGVHHGANVVHALFGAAEAECALRQTGAPLVERDHPGERREVAEELAEERRLPRQIGIRDESRHENEVDLTLAEHLIRDRQIAALRVLRLGCVHPAPYRPFHFGSRFSANAATPSAVSSDPLVIVSMAWRYSSASSGSMSSTR
jgi:hypothetical protein